MNYVTAIYLLNLLLYSMYFFGQSEIEANPTSLDYTVSGVLSLLLIIAGYLNARKGMTFRSVLWVFFVNLFLFTCSGLFDQFGSDFNILSTGNSNSFIFTAAFIVYNAYLYPLIVILDGSGFPFIFPLLLSFILPSLGYWIRMKNHPQKRTDSTESN